MRRVWLLTLVPLGLGCATAVFESPAAPADPWGQRALAGMLDRGLDEARSSLTGKRVRIEVVPPDAPFSGYALAVAEETVWAGGGQTSPRADEPWSLVIAVAVAGRERAERSLFLPVGQYLRLPLYYGQDDGGEHRSRLTLAGPDGRRTWAVTASRAGRSSYAFRVFGPFVEGH